MDVVARDDTSDEALAPPLSQAVGYVVVVVVGLIIAFGKSGKPSLDINIFGTELLKAW